MVYVGPTKAIPAEAAKLRAEAGDLLRPEEGSQRPPLWAVNRADGLVRQAERLEAAWLGPDADGADTFDVESLSKEPPLRCYCGRPGIIVHTSGAWWCPKCWEDMEYKDTDKRKDLGNCHLCREPGDFRASTGDVWCHACWDRMRAPREQTAQAGAYTQQTCNNCLETKPCRLLQVFRALKARWWCDECWGTGLYDGRARVTRATEDAAPEPPAVKERMDKIPPRALLWAGRAMAHGMKYEEEDTGWADWLARTPAHHLNRAMRHIALYLAGDTSEDHPGHVIGRILMWGDRLAAEAEEGA